MTPVPDANRSPPASRRWRRRATTGDSRDQEMGSCALLPIIRVCAVPAREDFGPHPLARFVSMIDLRPVYLKGVVSVEPLGVEHHDALVAASTDGRLWELWFTA